jgi:hypothetical protein
MDYNIALPQFNVAPVQNTGPLNMLTDVMKLKGLQREEQLNQLKMQEYARARGDAATKRAEDAKTKAELARIYGAGVNNLSPAAPANNLVAPAEVPTPQMGFGAGVGEYAPAPAPAVAPAAAAAPTPGAPNYAGIITELVRGGHIEEAKKMADLAKSHTETRGKEYENSVKQIDAAYAPLQALTNRVQSPADVAAYTQMLYNDPVLGPQAAKIKPLEQAIADSQREFAANPQQWQLAHSKVDGKVIYDAATNSVAPKIAAKDVGGSIKYIDENPKSPTFMKEVGDFAKTLSPAQGAKEMPPTVKLAQGEVWNKEAGRVDAVPGSGAYIKRSQEHSEDVTGLDATKDKTEYAIDNIKKMLSDENKEGFSANFGGYKTTLTSRAAGKAADFKGMLDTFKSNIKAAGLEAFRAGGSIGAMTEKEWPIVASEIASLDGWMTEDNARNVMRNVIARMERIKKNSERVYDTTWGETQFHPKNKNAPSESTTPDRPPIGSFGGK